MPIDESLPFLPVNIAVLTVSDTRDMASDRSGQTLQERIEAAGHRCVAREIAKDEADAIEFRRVRYDVDRTQRIMREVGLPARLAERLRGRSERRGRCRASRC